MRPLILPHSPPPPLRKSRIKGRAAAQVVVVVLSLQGKVTPRDHRPRDGQPEGGLTFRADQIDPTTTTFNFLCRGSPELARL
jgi:hypothetical protein